MGEGTGDRVLEPGCGAGRLTELLARAVGPRGAVLACDVSEEMVRRAKARVASPPAEVRVASLTDLASPAASFDHAVLLNVLTSVRPAMVRAFFREFRKTRNLRDAMQAYVHALRNHSAAAVARRRRPAP